MAGRQHIWDSPRCPALCQTLWSATRGGVPTGTGPALPPSPEVRPKRHTGWGLVPISAGVPLLHQLWPAAQGRVACPCTTQRAYHLHSML